MGKSQSDNGAKADASDDALKKLKAALKNYDELAAEYDLTEEHFNTKAVLRRMGEVLEGYVKILIQLLQPEEFHSLHECTVFDDSDKEKIFDAYKNLMITHREILKTEIINNEAGNISTINFVHSEIKRLKPEMIRIIGKMQDSWKNDDIKKKQGYFG